MNKIFKIVFNAARGKMMVVNEATSSVQTGKKAAVTVAVIGALASGSALAEFNSAGIGWSDYKTTTGVEATINADTARDILPTNPDGNIRIQASGFNFEDNFKLETPDLNVLFCTHGGEAASLKAFDATNKLVAKNLFIHTVKQTENGGVIETKEDFTLNGSSAIKGMQVNVGGTLTTNDLRMYDGATIKAKYLNLAKSNIQVYGDSFIDASESTVSMNADTRIQLHGNKSIQIGTLNVNGAGTQLSDRMSNTEADGDVVSFDIKNVNIDESADLTVYAKDKDNDLNPETSIKFGTVDMKDSSKLNLGFRSGDFDNSLGQTTIDTLKLGAGATVDVKTGTSADLTDNADVKIDNIEINGDDASVAGNLVGDETNITVDDGVTGASIAKISAKKARITVEPNAEDQLTIEEVATDSKVEVTTEQDINTGNAEADLDKLASAVNVNDGEVTLAVAENDVYGALSGTLDKTGLSDVVQAVNTKTQAVADQVTLAPQMITRIMMNDVRKRMGDLRATEGTHGVWARYNGGQMAGSGMEADFNMIQVGIDTVPVVDAPRFGVAFSYAQTEANATNGVATTDMDAFSLAFYGTKMYDNGMFVDVIGRMATVDADMNVSGNKGKMDNVALSLSGELGWRFDVTDRFFIEPSAELTYTYTNADTFTMGTGKYELEATDSLVGRAGFAAGFKCPANKGDVYVRAAVVHEFMGDVTMNSWGANGNAATPIETDGEDTYFEYAVGAQFNINKNTYVYADVERTEGANVDEDWRANVGVRFAF